MADKLVERLLQADRNSVQRMNGSRIFYEAAARIQSDAAEIARLRAGLVDARGNVTALEASLHAHNCGTPGCLCISTSIRDLARAGDPEPPE